MTNLEDYEQNFLLYYKKRYNIKYIKVNHNEGLVPTKVTLYNTNKRVIKHQPTFYGVTVKTMFQELKHNKIYDIDKIIKGSE